MERRLAAILAADVVGFSRLMAFDEADTFARLKVLRQDLVEPKVAAHRGRIVKLMGDGALVEFASVVDAVDCAIQIQREMAEGAAAEPEGRRIVLRIGVNLGDVIIEGRDIYGDGVNVAARLESLAPPGGICISGTVLEHVEGKLDLAFEDLGRHDLKNIARPVHVFRVDWDRKRPPPQAVRDEPLMRRPAVAVLPFVNMSGDAEQAYFSDGLSEDLITALSHWRSFPVIARNSTFAYKNTALDVRRVGHELGARYVLEGSVRKAGGRVRVTGQLIDAETGHHIWAEKFDRPLDDVFAIQDELSQRIAATVAPELEQVELKKAAAKRSEDLTAWDFYVRAMPDFHLETCEGNARARELFEYAIERDPDYAEAWARLGWTQLRDVGNGCTDDRDGTRAKGFEAARRAIALDDASAVAHLCLGTAYVWSEQLEQGLAEAERALELNPSYAHARMAVGNRLDLIGRTEEGIAQMRSGLQLNPRDPHCWVYMIYLARGYITLGHCQTALEWSRKAVQLRPDHPSVHHRLAICLAHLGRVDEARAALDQAERLKPGFVKSRAGWRPYADEARNAHYLAGLRRHGLMD
jgi:adenylate cyclase